MELDDNLFESGAGIEIGAGEATSRGTEEDEGLGETSIFLAPVRDRLRIGEGEKRTCLGCRIAR